MYVLKCYWVEFIASFAIGFIVAIVYVASTIPSVLVPLDMEISVNKCISLGTGGRINLKNILVSKI